MQPPQRFGNQGQKFIGYNLSGRTSPFRSRMPTNANPKITSSSTRTSPTMIMRKMAPDLNTKFTKKRVNSGIGVNSNLLKRPSGSFHSGVRSNFIGLAGSKVKGRVQRTQVKVQSGRKVEYGGGKKLLEGNKKVKITPARKPMQNAHLKNARGSISSQKEVKSETLESLLSAHEKILSSAMSEIGKVSERKDSKAIRISGNTGARTSKPGSSRLDILQKYRNQKGNFSSFKAEVKRKDTKEEAITGDIKIEYDKSKGGSFGAKKSLISSIRKNVISRGDRPSEARNEQQGGNYSPQVYSNLQIVNSNIYFPVVQGGNSSAQATPIRVERKHKTDGLVRIEGNFKRKEEDGVEEEVKGEGGEPGTANLDVETMPVGGNLAMRYEDTLGILQSKVDAIKADVLGDAKGAKEEEAGGKNTIQKTQKKEQNLTNSRFDSLFGDRESKKKEPTKKKKRRRTKNSNLSTSKSQEKTMIKNNLKTENGKNGKNNKRKKRSKKSKFLEVSESRELNRFDRSLLENNDTGYDSMLLGRRKRDKRGDRSYKSLQKKNPKIRFKDFSTKKEYTKRYNNKKKAVGTKNNDQNTDFLALLEDQSDDEEDIENVKFEVSSICSDIGGFVSDLNEKKKGYSELTKSKFFNNFFSKTEN